ncbi:MAG TPA: OmpA family protein [Stellaceae bacterium]|nr:OmpA family protein [Stellaceae bacterium]
MTFRPGTQEPSEQGKTALANALGAAQDQRPDFVAIVGSAPAAAGAAAAGNLARERADAIAAALVKAGVDARLISKDIRAVDDKSFAERQDNLIVQLGYGKEAPAAVAK